MLRQLPAYLRRPSNRIWAACLIYYLLMALLAPGFFSFPNTWNLLYTFLPLVVIAMGQTFVMLTGGIDLSITAVVAVSSVVGGYCLSSDYAPFGISGGALFLGLLMMIIAAVFIGLINGLSVAWLKMPAFMVTLTSMMFFGGLAIWMTQSQNIYNLPSAFVDFPYRFFFGVPVSLFVAAGIFILAYLLLSRSIYGEWIYALGANQKVATISGVPVNRMLVLVYILSAVSAALGSMFYTARLETGSPVMGQNILLDVIGAVVIGGTSLFGGKGKLSWTIAGALLMTMLDNSLNLIGLSFFLIMIVKGLIILVTAFLNVVQERKTTAYVKI